MDLLGRLVALPEAPGSGGAARPLVAPARSSRTPARRRAPFGYIRFRWWLDRDLAELSSWLAQ